MQGEPLIKYKPNKATQRAILEALELQMRALHASGAVRITTLHSKRLEYRRACSRDGGAPGSDHLSGVECVPSAAAAVAAHMESTAHRSAGTADMGTTAAAQHAATQLFAPTDQSAWPDKSGTVHTPVTNSASTIDTLADHKTQRRGSTQESAAWTFKTTRKAPRPVGSPEMTCNADESVKLSDDAAFEKVVARVKRCGASAGSMHHLSAHQVHHSDLLCSS